MILFITSSPFGEYRGDHPTDYPGFNPENGLEENVQRVWPQDARVLLVASDPDAYDWMDQIRRDFIERIEGSHLTWSTFDIIDHRYQCSSNLQDYDVIFLAGGHVPTQNRFMHEINLPAEIQDFDGIVMGISAGSMNCAKVVYAQPEEWGESDPAFPRFIPGLGLSDTNIIPHYYAVKDDILDGVRKFEDITYADSYGHTFLCLPDGSYILKEGNVETIWGECFQISNGQIIYVK